MSNQVFQVGDELIVEKGKEGMVNGRYWANTGKYWARGTNASSRTSASRGTHKVFKSKAPELAKAEKVRMKGEVNALANQMLASNFGTRVQYKKGPNGKMVKYNVPQYAEYSPELKESLAAMGIHNRPRFGAQGMPGARNNNNDEDLSGAMGRMGLGGKRRKTHRRHSKRRSLRKTKRRN